MSQTRPAQFAWMTNAEWPLRQEVEAAIGKIDEVLAEHIESENSLAMSGGLPSLAVFYATLANQSGAELHRARALRVTDRILELIPIARLNVGLYGGIAGVAWSLQYCGAMLARGGEVKFDLSDVDEVLLEALALGRWRGHFDVVSGLAGIGVYAVARYKASGDAQLPNAICSRLMELAERPLEGALCWRTHPHLLPTSSERSQFPEGNFNLGLAHGVPSVVSVLSSFVRLGLGGQPASEALRESTNWLLSQREMSGNLSYRATVGSNATCRNGWCYGDLGVCIALFKSGQALGDQQISSLAIDIALRTLTCPEELHGVQEPTLCHGAAGSMHLYNRLFNATGLKQFRESAEFWAIRTLQYRSEARPNIGGFSFYSPLDQTWSANVGLLTGTSGIGLALLAMISETVPVWDEFLMVDL
jgi:lantibiotic modifying enzyme